MRGFNVRNGTSFLRWRLSSTSRKKRGIRKGFGGMPKRGGGAGGGGGGRDGRRDLYSTRENYRENYLG